MILEHINAYSAGVIAVWATWCILSGKVRDGVLGKIIYAVIALSGYAILARSEQMFFSPTIAGTTLYVSLALAGARHWFMVTYWPQTKAWLCQKLNCEHCLRCDKTPGSFERRK
ncbi:hypothetical protein [Pseudomonas sp.]|uniref:hypothetical protein n=1 Tax=Pseudomonas sp. TaxID=306 RepID=UPI00262CA55A|nr:hypothetical protein [Pseudomonas sp.]